MILRLTLKKVVGVINRGEEDYIKAIYVLRERQGEESMITNLQLAQYLSHTVQTVSEMIKKLAHKDLVIYKPYKGSTLTDKGEDVAARMIRIHRIWETLLVDQLGYPMDAVHHEAERLEHATTDMLEERLYNFLGEPQTCPHGNAIPRKIKQK